MRAYLYGLLLAVLGGSVQAATYDLSIDELPVNFSGKARTAIAINGTVPGPTLRFKEGEEAVINVTNHLDEPTALHWHGLILPYTMDGVPGFGFKGIAPGETFTYRFKVQQNGTYWYHSHAGMQEQIGTYGALIIEPASREPFKYDRDHVLLLSDWTDENPHRIMANLKKQSDYYNYGQQTVGSFFSDVKEKGWDATVRDRMDWGEMRMLPTDIADVSGYTFLINGQNPDRNWTGLFQPGERVRLRLINGSAMSYFDVRIPGLKMTVVQADGNHVAPVAVDELRIAVAETYDVIVQPKDEQAYTIFAESLDRSGYARGTLAPREGMTAAVPDLRPRPLLTMADMGMAHEGMDHGSMNHEGMNHAGMNHGGMDDGGLKSGLTPVAANGGKVLAYGDLRAIKPSDYRAPDREIELRLTGNMERYFWSFNGQKYSEAEPIRLKYGERVRFKFVNETMMSHPMHLHGMWMQLDLGKNEFNPLKHIVNVPPGETVYVDVPVDAKGEWAFHCHLLYHMMSGMFRKIIVEDLPAS